MGTSVDVERIDLAALSAHLKKTVVPAPEGAVVGRTTLRDAVAGHLGCSMVDAEALVETMIGRGFLVPRETAGRVVWSVVPTPPSLT